jgi:hypothetical protein
MNVRLLKAKRVEHDMLQSELVFFASANSSLLQKFFPRHRWGIFM